MAKEKTTTLYGQKIPQSQQPDSVKNGTSVVQSSACDAHGPIAHSPAKSWYDKTEKKDKDSDD